MLDEVIDNVQLKSSLFKPPKKLDPLKKDKKKKSKKDSMDIPGLAMNQYS